MEHSSQVQLTRDGRTLVVADPAAVTLVELRGSGRRPPEPRPPMIADALEPRSCRSRLPLGAALIKLDREIESITLWALRASLSPGDPRRLGHGDEGLTAARDAHTEHEAALATDPAHRSASIPTGALADEAGAVTDGERRVARLPSGSGRETPRAGRLRWARSRSVGESV